MEAVNNEWFEPEQDPRETLAGSLRNFFLQAIRHQRLIDGQFGAKPAGSLYKTDAGFLKIKLVVPDADRVFGASESGTEAPADTSRPALWVLIPLGLEEQRSDEFDLIDHVVATDDITVHVIPADGETSQFLVRDDYIGPKSPVYETLEQLQAHHSPDEFDQINTANYWASALEDYDIRTVHSTQRETA